MTHHPIHQPPTHQPPEHAAELTPAQHAQLQALVAHAVAIATRDQTDTNQPNPPVSRRGQQQRSLSVDPGMTIALVALAVVALVAIVAVFTIALGL